MLERPAQLRWASWAMRRGTWARGLGGGGQACLGTRPYFTLGGGGGGGAGVRFGIRPCCSKSVSESGGAAAGEAAACPACSDCSARFAHRFSTMRLPLALSRSIVLAVSRFLLYVRDLQSWKFG